MSHAISRHLISEPVVLFLDASYTQTLCLLCWTRYLTYTRTIDETFTLARLVVCSWLPMLDSSRCLYSRCSCIAALLSSVQRAMNYFALCYDIQICCSLRALLSRRLVDCFSPHFREIWHMRNSWSRQYHVSSIRVLMLVTVMCTFFSRMRTCSFLAQCRRIHSPYLFG